MRRIAKFELVSKEQWTKDWMKRFGTGREEDAVRQEAEAVYGRLKTPKRATTGSAGYDFYTPVDIDLLPGESVMIPTGVRCRMAEDFVLLIVPRSSLGMKYRLQLKNTTGVIDSDYYHSDNEGHMFIPLINAGRDGKEIHIPAGTAVAQGLFVMYGITEDDDTETVRNGGFGSTDK